MDDILTDIVVPSLDCPLALESKERTASKDIFAEQKRHAWDKSVEARCDFSRKVRITRRGDVFFISLWQKSLYGRTLTDIKSDDSMVTFFAENVAPLIKEILGYTLANGDWCIVTTPKRLGIPFYEDVAFCHSKKRIGAVFTLNVLPKENNCIVFDDFVTTGSTLKAMRTLLLENKKNCVFFTGINNKL